MIASTLRDPGGKILSRGKTEECSLGRYARHLVLSHMLAGNAQQRPERLAEAEDRLHAQASNINDRGAIA